MESTEEHNIEKNGSDHTDNEAANNHKATDLVVRMISSDNQEMMPLQKTADTVSKIPVSLVSRAARWDKYPRPLIMSGVQLVTVGNIEVRMSIFSGSSYDEAEKSPLCISLLKRCSFYPGFLVKGTAMWLSAFSWSQCLFDLIFDRQSR